MPAISQRHNEAIVPDTGVWSDTRDLTKPKRLSDTQGCAHPLAGDTVNTASRMESTSFPMCIQASAAVVEDASMPDSFVPLGDRAIKGKGIMPTFLYKVRLQPMAPFSRRICLVQPAGMSFWGRLRHQACAWLMRRSAVTRGASPAHMHMHTKSIIARNPSFM